MQPIGGGTVASTSLHNLFNEYQLAELTRMSVASIRRWRLLRQGPKYVKLGASVRYRPEDVSEWLAALPSGGGHPAGVSNGGGDA